FPTFTLNPGEYVVLYEGEGTNTDKALYTGGSQIEWPLTAQTVNGQLVSQPETLAGLGTIQQPITPVFAAQVDTATSGDLPGADSASAQETPATPAQPETIEPANPAVGETPKLDIP